VLVPYHIRRANPHRTLESSLRRDERASDFGRSGSGRGNVLPHTLGRALESGAHGERHVERCAMITQLKHEQPETEKEPTQPEPVAPRRPMASVAGLVRGVDVEMRNALVGAVMAGTRCTSSESSPEMSSLAARWRYTRAGPG
jgi:hypothetical protein